MAEMWNTEAEFKYFHLLGYLWTMTRNFQDKFWEIENLICKGIRKITSPNQKLLVLDMKDWPSKVSNIVNIVGSFPTQLDQWEQNVCYTKLWRFVCYVPKQSL